MQIKKLVKDLQRNDFDDELVDEIACEIQAE